MATLQTSRQNSAFTARSRLKQVVREHSAMQALLTPAPAIMQTVEKPVASLAGAIDNALSGTYRQRLSELDQRQVLLKTISVYNGWRLVSVQHRPESDLLVAHLMRKNDQRDPAVAVREGRTMQIIMDSVGDMKMQYARANTQGVISRWFAKFIDLVKQIT